MKFAINSGVKMPSLKVRVSVAKVTDPHSTKSYNLYNLETVSGKTLPHGVVSSMKAVKEIVKENGYTLVK